MLKKKWSLLFGLVLILLLHSTSAAINEEVNRVIELAIKSAVQDGLKIIDDEIRNEYWYYLYGATRATFNVSVKPQTLNYIIIYKNYNNYFRVNVDLNKISWTPRINNFVKILTPAAQDLPTIQYISNNTNVIDLTNQIQINTNQKNSSSNNSSNLSISNKQIGQQAQPLANSGEKVIVLVSSLQNNDSNK